MRILCIGLALLVALTGFAQPQPVDAFGQNRRLGPGVNILGYDPIWRSRDQARFQARHFQLLKTAGFNSVRLNLHPFRHMDRDKNWALQPSWFDTLDWAIQHATDQGLMIILDLHEFGAMGDNPEGNKDKFLAFWRQLSGHCQNASDKVLIEILNEPANKLTPALWNQYLGEALALIREKNPTRTVIVGSAFWNSIDHLPELELPKADRNLLVTVHYYKPMDFTHQGAAWSGHKDKSGVSWTGTEAERQAIRVDFERAATWGKENNRPIFLGEFGAYDKAGVTLSMSTNHFSGDGKWVAGDWASQKQKGRGSCPGPSAHRNENWVKNSSPLIPRQSPVLVTSPSPVSASLTRYWRGRVATCCFAAA